MSRLLLPLLFAHPLYVWLRRRIRDDQEALADAAGASREGRIAYAEALVCWSRTGSDQTSMRLTPSLGLWGRSSSLAGRVALILDRDFRIEPSCPTPWRRAVRGSFVAMMIALVLASLSGSARLSLGATGSGRADSGGKPHVHEVGALTGCFAGLEPVEARRVAGWVVYALQLRPRLCPWRSRPDSLTSCAVRVECEISGISSSGGVEQCSIDSQAIRFGR